MQIIIRGATVGFSTTFVDEKGIAYDPPSAQLLITYRVSGNITTDTINLVKSSGQWIGSWNSNVADAEQVDWFIASTSGIKCVDEGSFFLVKNTANPGT